jgi:oxalate decarboxylase/phosphoglucose isomerase-like protein (cupin superfamily)
VKSYQTEIWDTLEPPATVRHDFKVLDMMGRDGPITRVRQFSPALQDLKKLGQIALALRENDIQTPIGYAIADPEWDNDFMRSHQEPRTQEPSSAANTISDRNYLLDFQRAYFVDATKIEPVRYRNAMMDPENPDMSDDNVLEMRWLIQREFGSSVVFFHEVTIPAGKVEGTHWHIGTEELYYVTSGQGIVYMGEGDDPTTSEYPTVSRHVYGVGFKDCKEIPVRAGHMLFTKSGGIHGIRNTGAAPLKFVAFLYHSS